MAPFRVTDFKMANEVRITPVDRMGNHLREFNQDVRTLSGAGRQIVADARAVYLGAKVPILDKPASALGPRQTSNAPATITTSAAPWPPATAFTVLKRGQALGTAQRGEIKAEEL